MALKPTIYKARIALSDLNRDYYDTLNLTIAQHPSETLERMMARIVAYCINAEEYLLFTKGLSETEEPDIWLREYNDDIKLWIDIGEPTAERMKKASRSASKALVYSFNSKSPVWWQSIQNKVNNLDISVYQLSWAGIQQLAHLVERTMDLSVTITGDSAYIAAAKGECEVSWLVLQDSQ
ncbi:YaeQ family protein [Neptunicella sp.]|uniref:YaeQ family protein n=1 Tax=Neptunicella sp. TaxID=2125986 RepID=UPI003F691FAC